MNNEILLGLYEANKAKINQVKSRCPANMNGPFLIAPNDLYWASSKKIAFVGQETHGWPSVEEYRNQMQEYQDFDLGKNYYSSPFWSTIRKLESTLTGSMFSSAWLNINRFDQSGGPPSNEAKKNLTELDFILVEEIKAISPQVIVFLTGPSYDDRLLRLLNFTTQEVSGFNKRQLSIFNSHKLTAKIIRTYHPNYLRRSGLESSIIDAIAKTAFSN